MLLAFKHIDGKGKAASWKRSKESFDAQEFVDGVAVEIPALPTQDEAIDPKTLAVIPRVKRPTEIQKDIDVTELKRIKDMAGSATARDRDDALKILIRRFG